MINQILDSIVVMTVRFDSRFFDSMFRFWFNFLRTFHGIPSVSYYIVKLEFKNCAFLIDEQRCMQFVHHFVLLGKNVALLPPFENFQIRQTMCDTLIFMFSNMAMNGSGLYVVYRVVRIFCIIKLK